MKKEKTKPVPDRETAMGDTYRVYRYKEMWCAAIIYKDGRTRVCCTGSPFLWVARDVYFDDVQAAQKDTLDGRNPYMSASRAHAYKTAV